MNGDMNESVINDQSADAEYLSFFFAGTIGFLLRYKKWNLTILLSPYMYKGLGSLAIFIHSHTRNYTLEGHARPGLAPRGSHFGTETRVVCLEFHRRLCEANDYGVHSTADDTHQNT